MKLSIRFMTYNQEQFVFEALEGVNNQITNFSFELVIGDDFSTDRTLEIIKNYKFSNPNILLKILHRVPNDSYYFKRRKNGRLENFKDIIEHCKGEYIALLDGDDYWTDPLKLQKQIDFLEKNNDYSICFHRANLLTNGKLSLHKIPDNQSIDKFEYYDLLKSYNFITTASVVFRQPENFVFPKWFQSLPFGDLGLYALVSNNKKIKCLPETMSVYRIHNNGIYHGITREKKLKNHLTFYHIISSHLTKDNKAVLVKKRKKILRQIANYKYGNNFILKGLYYMYMYNFRYRL